MVHILRYADAGALTSPLGETTEAPLSREASDSVVAVLVRNRPSVSKICSDDYERE